MQLPMFAPGSEWRPPKVSELPSWEGAGRVALDCETRDEHLIELGPGVRRGGYVVGFSYAIEDGPAGYVPLAHAGGDNVEDPEAAIQYLRDQAKLFKGDLCGVNLSYDLDYLEHRDVKFSPRWYRDVQVAEPLINELHSSYGMDAIAKRRGLPGKDDALIVEASRCYGFNWRNYREDLWRLPARYVGPYAEQDARLPLQLLRRQEKDIDEQELWDIYNLESRLLPVLLKVRRRGVRIDFDKLSQIEKWSLNAEAEALAEVKRLTLVTIPLGDVWKAELLAKALDAIGVKPPLTPKTQKPSVDSDLLESIDHDVARALLKARKVNKVRTTFCNSIREHQTNGRIHCVLNQLRRSREGADKEDVGAAYGRMSSENPNLQQQPARDEEIGPMWRSIYVPDEGGIWFCADYSQQEPRMTVHYSELKKFSRAFEAAERYRNDPKTDNHQMMADLTGLPRKQAKDIFLGLCYGMGEAKLCREIGLPTEWKIVDGSGKLMEVAGPAGKVILEKFHSAVPFVKKLAKDCQKIAEKRGYIKTILGRRCRFPRVGENVFDWTHKALNRLIQGGSADQTKLAMVETDAAGHYIQLQVHDELDGTVQDPAEAEKIAEIMRNCVKLRVPSRVDVGLGKNWGECG